MTKVEPIARPLLARRKFFGGRDVGTPYVSDGDSARVLCFMNLSGAYDGNTRADEAMADATLFAASPELLAFAKAYRDMATEVTNRSTTARPTFRQLNALLEQATAAISKALT